MAEELTLQQREAVENQGGRLLVSAAAGSGKTKVLVDRLLRRVMDPVAPADLDDFLIITYTKAAASELRGKIAAKLSQHMALQPQNRHLQRQMQRLYLAKISTVHGFCADILKEYAYLLDLPADFRVADENECSQLREVCVEKLLNAAYENAESDGDFRAFVDTQGLGRDDRLVPQILLKVFDSSRCHLDPEKWLDECVSNAQVGQLDDASQTIWGAYLMKDLFHYLDLQIAAMKQCVDAALAADGLQKPAAVLCDTLAQMERIRRSVTWDEIVARANIDFGRLTFPRKDYDVDLSLRIKAVRSACKKGLEKKLAAFRDDSAAVLSDLNASSLAVKGLVNLVKRFSQDFDRAKRARRILDFGDLEQRTLDLLLGRQRRGATAVSREIAARFAEIMVDEYQDSNAVQDAIFTVLTEDRKNCFMVGDVKQSIYQFRLADPGIFLDKYRRYLPADVAQPGEGRKVLLTKNFRSGGDVLKGVNDVFFHCMSENVGGLAYGPEEALQEGIPHTALGEPEVELWTIPVENSTYDEEPAFVANRIQTLLDGKHYVRQGDALRPIEPQDIAILLRSPGSVGGHFVAALANLGIRCTTGGGEDLLKTAEVSVLRAILQTISNPRQDIPLIAALSSPVFGFTADDLAAVRCAKRGGCFFDALIQSERSKAKDFLKKLDVLRSAARAKTISELIGEIFHQTRMDSIYGAMPDGDVRKGNLLAIYQLASDFSSANHRDLEQFLDHLFVMEEKGLITAAEQTAQGAVTLMSIHKSKGLEFPVVIVAGLSRSFNREDLRAQVLCDQTLGLGLSAVDAVNRVRYPTVAKRAITAKTVSDSLSEEMRVLYVALTRARDRLIMTYASKTLETDLADIVLRMDIGHRELLTGDVVCPGEWVLMAALGRTEAGALHAVGGRPQTTVPGEPAWRIGVVSNQPGTEECEKTLPSDTPAMPIEIGDTLRNNLAFQYPYLAATTAPSKQTATQRKGRNKDAEVAENAKPPVSIYRSWRKPSFREKQLDGTIYGSTIHSVLQYIRYENCTDEAAVEEELQRLVTQHFITYEQREMTDSGKIARFFATELGKKLRQSEHVLREFKFSILDNGENYGDDLKGERVLLQGVVDCALIEDGGITIIDFKTDKVSPGSLEDVAEKYRTQVLSYADALRRIYQMPVKQALLYFFQPECFVSM